MCKAVRLICVTNRKLVRGDFLERLKEIARQRPAGILLREKDLTPEEYRKLAREVQSICKKAGVPCILHSFTGVAEELEADALHLPLPLLRKLPGEDRGRFRQLGASCHSISEAREAMEMGCTYITAGHIFETDCKRGRHRRHRAEADGGDFRGRSGRCLRDERSYGLRGCGDLLRGFCRGWESSRRGSFRGDRSAVRKMSTEKMSTGRKET